MLDLMEIVNLHYLHILIFCVIFNKLRHLSICFAYSWQSTHQDALSDALVPLLLAASTSAWLRPRNRKLSNPNWSPASASSTAVAAAASTAATAVVATASATSAAVAKGSGRSVLTASTYKDVQVSSSTAGNAKANADAIFSAINQTNLASVSASDLNLV